MIKLDWDHRLSDNVTYMLVSNFDKSTVVIYENVNYSLEIYAKVYRSEVTSCLQLSNVSEKIYY